MMKKVPGDELGTVAVTFELDDLVGATSVALVGEFNGWSPDADLMERANGGYCKTLVLEIGRAYRFRYLVDGEHWMNAPDADDYARNDFGGEDSIVRTDDIGE
jgi:hypothetical protein